MQRSLSRGIAATLLLGGSAAAQSGPIRLQDARLKGSGSTLSITHVPVTVDGKTTNRDVQIELSVDGAGNVSVALGHPIVTKPTPPAYFAHFAVGSYQGADSSNDLIRLTGSEDPGEEAQHWTVTGLVPGGATPLYRADIITGPIETHPRVHRLENAGIESAAYSYGNSEGGYGNFEQGALLGMRQVGNTLVIVSFSKGCCADGNTPTAVLKYTLTGK